LRKLGPTLPPKYLPSTWGATSSQLYCPGQPYDAGTNESRSPISLTGLSFLLHLGCRCSATHSPLPSSFVADKAQGDVVLIARNESFGGGGALGLHLQCQPAHSHSLPPDTVIHLQGTPRKLAPLVSFPENSVRLDGFSVPCPQCQRKATDVSPSTFNSPVRIPPSITCGILCHGAAAKFVGSAGYEARVDILSDDYEMLVAGQGEKRYKEIDVSAHSSSQPSWQVLSLHADRRSSPVGWLELELVPVPKT
jgi:hypothetical protein